MSKKLLEESTIRSFMKLANLKPLSEKFISEKYGMKEEEEHEEEKEEEEEDKKEEEEGKMEEELAPPADPRRPETGKQEEAKVQEEGKESEGRPASKREAPKGTSLAGKAPGKMDAAKNAPGDAKLKPAQKSSHHSDKPDSIETKNHSNAPKKNNSQFEVVSESLEEEMAEVEEAPEAGADTPSDAAGEGGDHQAKMKGLIRDMLEKLKDMGAEYGMSMEISDEAPAGAEEMAPAASGEEAPMMEEESEGEDMMQEKLDEMVEKLTKRVAARLVKESKKKA